MNKIIKFVSSVMALSITLSCLCGCHGKKATPKDVSQQTQKPVYDVPAEFDESQQCEITFWAKNDTNKTQTNIYKKAISDFEALYPNIKVKYKPYTDYTRIYSDVITNIATNTTPNVCITYPDHIATYITGENTVVPLDDFIGNEKYGLGGSSLKFDSVSKNEIIPEYLNEGVISGTTYCLPFMRSTEACYVNSTFVEKLGYTMPETLTWDFIWEVSEKAMEKDEDGNYKVNSQKVLIPFIYKSTDNMMIQMLYQKGAPYSDSNGKISVFGDETEQLLKEIAPHAESGAFSTFKISSYPANYLNAGQCIFAIDSTAGATWMGSDAPLMDISNDAVIDFECSVMSVPQYDPAHPKMISQGPSLCIFNKENKQEVLASWLFMQYLLTNDVQIPYSETEGYVPVTSKARESKEYKEYLSLAGSDNDTHYTVKMRATELLLNNAQNTFVTPVFNGSASLRDAAGQMIEEVTKSARRNETVDSSYISKLYKNMTAQFHLKLS